mmetsp:Transcript_18382/g.27570  ORF Transcript_18382/g.27570 Transcript_18382/m.27570 type:complete len:397 (+) Transcript_18382:140-1330(+)
MSRQLKNLQAQAASKNIVQAILSFSPDRLQTVIDDVGPDAVNLPLTNNPDAGPIDLEEYDDIPSEYEVEKGDVIALQRTNGFTFPLHVAVACVYSAITSFHKIEEALRAIDVLIANGADVEVGTGHIFVLNMEGHCAQSFNEDFPHNQAVHLAMWLKKYPWSVYESETDQHLNAVIKKLDRAASALKSKLKKNRKVSTTEVLSDVASSYENLLFSDNFSDVTFKCSDGVSVPAHKAILAASSDYFKAAFRGPWAENNENGVWETTHSSKLMRSVLTILYTGTIAKCNELLLDKDVDQMTLFELSSEYGINLLITLTTENCIRSINEKSLKKFLMKADLYSNEKLKQACFDFIRRNPTATLTDSNIMALASEEPDLWGELKIYLNGEKKSRKRSRKH